MLTLKFDNVYIKDWYSIAGRDEYLGNIHNANEYMSDLYFGEKTLEAAEVKMQRTVLDNLKQKYRFDLVIGGDLSNQIATMNMTMRNYDKSFLGIYNACSTFVEGLIIGSNMLDASSINNACILTSSHILTSERQFRYPVEYGALRPIYTTTTMTGSVGAIISNDKSRLRIVSGTIGSVVDYGIKDASNIGAIMAPSAADVIYHHLFNNGESIDDYDLILTGDLGKVGKELLISLLKDKYNIASKKIMDAGSLIYKNGQNKLMGGSGPTCLPYVLFNKILKNKNIKRILIVGTGALHNPTLVNQKNSIPGISHAIEIEVQN